MSHLWVVAQSLVSSCFGLLLVRLWRRSHRGRLVHTAFAKAMVERSGQEVMDDVAFVDALGEIMSEGAQHDDAAGEKEVAGDEASPANAGGDADEASGQRRARTRAPRTGATATRTATLRPTALATAAARATPRSPRPSTALRRWRTARTPGPPPLKTPAAPSTPLAP